MFGSQKILEKWKKKKELKKKTIFLCLDAIWKLAREKKY